MPTLLLELSRSEMAALEDLVETETDGMRPNELAADWVRARLGELPRLYEIADPALPKNSRERLREHYRPDDVAVLFVGESAPAGGTVFYQADSHLFRAVREACVRAFGPLPDGPAFLEWFKERNFWLYDLAVEPVNRMRGRPRKDAVEKGVVPLARVMRDLGPNFVVTIKEWIAPTVRAAADLARMPQARVVVLPFPLYQWRERFVTELSEFLGASPSDGPEAPAQRQPRTHSSRPARRSTATPGTLHDAIIRVLRQGRGSMTSREIANAIARDDLYRRGDGKAPPASQI